MSIKQELIEAIRSILDANEKELKRIFSPTIINFSKLSKGIDIKKPHLIEN